ncbi:DUF2442 domain-containing protein [Dyadobacter sp. CY323]|uniref:DUF2442 domain-containing protein n=1 Tax=Dyadobacter sp. CY323 TaxID=2907302 RepID=UPI001F1901B4|nr:DUF2442 domain-containing protein [Dyadobacter sp. CY323]MCE6990336.1 DUF2442 domain-containing protein [Dyadobacter sp. CY323]
MNLVISVMDAIYLSDYKVMVRFSDNSQQTIDFKDFLEGNPHPQYNKYRNLDHFQKFKIENGNLVWGQNWDLIFPIEQLHAGKIAF